MKIRILNDTIRLRLDRDEVDRIGRGQPVIARTRFPDRSVFGYELHVDAAGAETVAAFSHGVIRLTLPAEQARHWATEESEVSITGQSASLELLIEKDFECLEPRAGESQSNRFANPRAGG
ncbi:MAG: DUF7009 family protein [Pseudomonadota bacterium]